MNEINTEKKSLLAVERIALCHALLAIMPVDAGQLKSVAAIFLEKKKD